MPDRSPDVTAAIRAVHGVSDLAAIMPALGNERLAHVIACAPDAHPLVRAVAALCGGLTSVLDESTIVDPALHAALAQLIGTPAGRAALRAWAEVAPAGWGRPHAHALIDAVQQRMSASAAHQRMCAPCTAAALIGPCDESAALLTFFDETAFALRRWGQSDPAAPTAWTTALSAGERRRLLDEALSVRSAVASCLPWLPPDMASQVQIDDDVLGDALTAFADASPITRAQGEAILRRLVARAHPTHLWSLTRLACAMQTEEVWTRVQMLVRESPDDARRVVVAAPWDDLADDVRAAILECADRSDMCAAVACARGHARRVKVTSRTAVAFFAALAPRVWDALDAAAQRQWRRALWEEHAHIAVRSLGLRPDILARATLNNHLASAAQRRSRNATALRATLLPVALRAVDADTAYVMMSAMRTPPPDPGIFFCIASGVDDAGIIAPAGATLRAPGDLALAVVLQRSAHGGRTHREHCRVVQHALRGRTWDDLRPIMPLLDARARAACMPKVDAFACRLAHPDRRDALRRTLAHVANLPPEVAIPTSIALKRWKPWNTLGTAAALADALHDHGDIVLALADALADDGLRHALLPLPTDPALARALRGLAHDDPVTAHRLAHALQTKDCRAALLSLLAASPHHAGAVWGALDNDVRRTIGAVVSVTPLHAVARTVRTPMESLALAAISSPDADLRNAGVTALAQRSALVRAVWEHLPLEAQQVLVLHPTFADLQTLPETCAIRRGRRRG